MTLKLWLAKQNWMKMCELSPHLAEVLLVLALRPVLPQHDVAQVEGHEPGEVLPVRAVTVEQAEEV